MSPKSLIIIQIVIFFQVFFALVLVAVAHAAPQLQQLDSLDGEPEPFNVRFYIKKKARENLNF